MQAAKTSRVRNVAVPLIMYGTAWKEDRTQALVLEAFATGFRAFDTANQRKHYVEGEVGAAVRAAIGWRCGHRLRYAGLTLAYPTCLIALSMRSSAPERRSTKRRDPGSMTRN